MNTTIVGLLYAIEKRGEVWGGGRRG